MTRHYIGISPSGETVFHNVRRDDTGEPLVHLDKDAAKTLRIDFGDWLEGTETISAATIVSSESVTATISTTGKFVDLALSAATNQAYGKVSIKVTFSSGDIWTSNIRVRRPARYTDEQTYRDYT